MLPAALDQSIAATRIIGELPDRFGRKAVFLTAITLPGRVGPVRAGRQPDASDLHQRPAACLIPRKLMMSVCKPNGKVQCAGDSSERYADPRAAASSWSRTVGGAVGLTGSPVGT